MANRLWTAAVRHGPGAWRSLVAHLLWEQRVACSNHAAPTIGGIEGKRMLARIYKPAKNAMQSGMARTKDWVLEFEPASARKPDPLMGWTSTTDLNGQIRLEFETREEAVAYAQRHGIAFRIFEPAEHKRTIKA